MATYLCSHCHTQFDAEEELGEGLQCPTCKVEAGLEPVKDGTPFAMKAFGLVVVGSLLLAGVGTAMSLAAGS